MQINKDDQNKILNILNEFIKKAGFNVSVSWREGAVLPYAMISSSSEDLSAIIGRDGQNILALEHLVKLIIMKKHGVEIPFNNFSIDINNYRKNQSDELVEIARQCAKRVLSTGRAESLRTMNSFERKIIHTELSSFEGLETQSIGTEPNRRIVIKKAGF